MTSRRQHRAMQRDAVRWARDHPAVFICGMARSGTTVMVQSLARHPVFASSVRQLETRAFGMGREIVAAVADPEQRQAIFVGDQRDRAAEHLRWLDDRPILPLKRQLLQRHLDALATAYLWFAWQGRHVERLLEKTPQHVRQLERVFRCFPRASVVVLVRHPLDVYASFKSRLERGIASGLSEDRLEWLRVTPGSFAERYVESTRAAVSAAARFPAQVHFIRYEHLTAEPEQTFRAVLDLLQVPWDDRVIEDADAAPAQPNYGRLSPQGAVAANPSVWPTVMSVEEARDVERATASARDQLGYGSLVDDGGTGQTE